ncbi:MAG: ABC transporter permease [Actinomycetota bacterium]|nr:ABC transporter permease [Actinomycetota bacterium]
MSVEVSRPHLWETSLSTKPDDADLVRVNAPQSFFRGFGGAVRQVWLFRELLVNLVRKELKVKYKDSVLGFLWSLVRPLCLLIIYWLVFGKFFSAGIPNFAFYLFAGLVAWDLFLSTLNAATTSIVSNSGLVKKVYFPREILPLATIGAGLVHFILQVLVLVSVLLAFRFDFFGPNLALFPIAIVALVLFMTSVCLLLSAVNVYLRDVQHLIEVFLLMWFWLTPVVYPVNFALTSLKKYSVLGIDMATVYMLNPMTNIVIAFQRAFYKNMVVIDSKGQPVKALYVAPYSSYLGRLAAVVVVSLGLIWLSQRIFARAQGNFAQEL